MNRLNTLRKCFKITTNVFGVLFAISFVGESIALANADAINSALGAKTQLVIEDADSTVDSLYYKSKYESIKDLKADTKNIIAEIAQEGCVLLKNDNALPVNGNKISFYSASSVEPVYTGAGSSGNANAEKITFKTAFENAGFTINNDLWTWYNNNKKNLVDRKIGQDVIPEIKDASWEEINTTSKNNPADVAVFVLSRYGGESEDVLYNTGSSSDMSNGNYLELSPKEISVLKALKALKDASTIKKIVVLMNAPTYVQCDFVDDANYGIDGLLWCGEIGTSGSIGIAKLFKGEMSPSGRITDIFYKKNNLNPVYANWGAKQFGGSGELIGGSKSQTYTVYQEGIYNGYRYAETRYEDKVMNVANVGDFSYSDAIAYPFGYGLSYNNFEYSNFAVNKVENKYVVTLNVKNAGAFTGKDVVQIYLQKPYTEYDKANHIEKSSVELVGYAKTKKLEPNQSDSLTIEIDEYQFTSYDSYGKKTYILESGDYYLTFAQNSHDAINNILNKKGFSVANGMDNAGNPAFVEKISLSITGDVDSTTYSKSNNVDVTNQFDNTDPNLYNDGVNQVTYVSRSNWNGTLNLSPNLSYSSKLIEDSKKMVIEQTGSDYPSYGVHNDLTLIDLRYDIENDKEIPFDDPLWEDLLDQLTWDETVNLLSNGLRLTSAVESIMKPQTFDHNGALGPVESYKSNDAVSENRYAFLFDDPDKDQYPSQFPCGSLLAATFNDELAKRVGEQVGEECLWGGYSGLYGPGCNIHRGAYCGRSFEYLSEDGFLSGKIIAQEIMGIQSKGTYVFLKHAILNDMETNREGICTFANEQTIREIYLKPFEIAIKEGDCLNVMTGFNRLGAKWNGQQGFVNTVLKQEFGMKGFAISDYWQSSYMNLTGGIVGGNDLPDGSTAYKPSESELYQYKSGYDDMAWAMRDSAHRILYVVCHSSAMNGFTSGTTVISLTPSWQKLISGLTVVSGVLFAVAGAGLIATFVVSYISKKKEQ